jgi:hypothetical protein
MKKNKFCGLLLATILSGSIFASEPFDIKFTSDNLKNDPTFNCAVNGEDQGNLLSPTSITIVADDNINILGANSNNGKAIDNLKIKDLGNFYFKVAKGKSSDSDGHISASTDNQTKLTCTRGTGNRAQEYTGS